MVRYYTRGAKEGARKKVGRGELLQGIDDFFGEKLGLLIAVNLASLATVQRRRKILLLALIQKRILAQE